MIHEPNEFHHDEPDADPFSVETEIGRMHRARRAEAARLSSIVGRRERERARVSRAAVIAGPLTVASRRVPRSARRSWGSRLVARLCALLFRSPKPTTAKE